MKKRKMRRKVSKEKKVEGRRKELSIMVEKVLDEGGREWKREREESLRKKENEILLASLSSSLVLEWK